MDADIAVLDITHRSQLLDNLVKGLSEQGYRFRTYSADKLAALEEALMQEHWLAIASSSLDENRLKDYCAQAKGGLIETYNPNSRSNEGDLRNSIEHGAVEFAYWMNVPNLATTIESATRLMHLPSKFFRNPANYCGDCLDVLAPRWKGSNEFGHPLKFYAWHPASRDSASHLAQLERAACLDFSK